MSIALQLGYPDDSKNPTLDATRSARANDIITQLTAIDTALASARLDSMASSIGELRVNYSQHMKLLKLEGSRLLQELSNLSGLPVAYDRFLGRVPSASSNSYSFVSYW